MNPKHITYPTRSNSHGEEEIPIFLQTVTHMDCSPYWYRFFVKNLPPPSKPTEDLPLTPIPGVYYDRAQGMTSLFQHIEPQASNTNIFVGNPDLRICVNIDARQDRFPETSLRAMARDVTEMFSSHPAYLKVMEVMLIMDQKILITVGGGIDLKSKANQLPGYVACCEVVYTGVDDTSLERWSDWQSRQLIDRRWPGHVPKLPLFPGTRVRGSQGTGNPEGKRNAPHFSVNVCSGVLIKNQEDQHMMTTAARIVRPGEVVGMREFFLQNRIGLAVDEVPGTDVAVVRLDEAIDYKNQDGTTTFTRLLGEESDDALPWNSIVTLATRWPPSTKGIIVAKSARVVRHPATTYYRVYHWAWTGQPGDEKGPNPTPRDSMIGAAAISETGVVTGLLYYNDHRFRAGYSVMLSANELVDAGYSLVT